MLVEVRKNDFFFCTNAKFVFKKNHLSEITISYEIRRRYFHINKSHGYSQITPAALKNIELTILLVFMEQSTLLLIT